MINTADLVVQNLKNMYNLSDSLKDLKEIKFESGINLVTALYRLEEKAKQQYLKKFKGSGGDFVLGKRFNPYSRQEGSEEFFFLNKKPQLVPATDSNTPAPMLTVPRLGNLLTQPGDNELDTLRINAAVKVSGVLNYFKVRSGNAIIPEDEEEDVLDSDDYEMLEFLKKDEYILLSTAGVWLSLEIAHYAYYTGSYRRYFSILNEILKTLGNPATIDIILALEFTCELFIKFFKELALINESVFFCLKEIILILQGKSSEANFLNVNKVLEIYQELLDKFNGRTDAISRGIYYLMDLGLNETVKLIRFKYYPHPSFTSIIDGYLLASIEELKQPLDPRTVDNIIKHLLAFAHGDNTYLVRVLDNYKEYHDGAKKIFIDRMDKFFKARFKAINPAEIPFIESLFSEIDQAQDVLDKLASYLKLHLPLLGLTPENQAALEEILKKFQKKKRVNFYCSLLMPADAKVDGVLSNLMQEELVKDVFIHLHDMAVYRLEEELPRIKFLIAKLIDLLPFDRVNPWLVEICHHLPLSPLIGVTILQTYKRYAKKDDIQQKENLYRDLMEKIIILLNNGGWNINYVWDAIVMFTTMMPWSQPLAEAMFRNVPQNILEATEERDKKFKLLVKKARESFKLM